MKTERLSVAVIGPPFQRPWVRIPSVTSAVVIFLAFLSPYGQLPAKYLDWAKGCGFESRPLLGTLNNLINLSTETTHVLGHAWVSRLQPGTSKTNVRPSVAIFIYHDATAPSWAGSPLNTLKHTTVGRTPLNE